MSVMKPSFGIPLALAGVLWLNAAAALAAPTVGQPAPAFIGKTLDGAALDLNRLKGQVVVINLWATWCAPCRQEMPALDAFYKQRKGKGVVLLGLSADRERDVEAVKRVMSAFSYPAAMLAEAKFNGFGNPRALPLTVVVGPDGLVRAVISGESGLLTADRLAAAVEPILPRKGPILPSKGM